MRLIPKILELGCTLGPTGKISTLTCLVAFSVASVLLSVGPTWAQTAATPSLPFITGYGLPERESTGLQLGNWLVYPTLTTGAVYNDNVYRSATNRLSSWGVRINPNVTAYLDNGIHKTQLYGNLNASFYSNTGRSDQVDAKAGFAHVYEAMRDLVVRVNGDYTRQIDVFTGGVVDAAKNPIIVPPRYNTFTGSATVERTLNRGTFAVGGSVSHTMYDGNSLGISRDGTIYTGVSRVGHWLGPSVYAFADGSVDTRRFDSGAQFDSHGYRVTGGLGSDRIGLFKGEIYAGYQAERFQNSGIGNVGTAVYGAKLFYYPLEELTVTAMLDRTIGVSTVATGSSPLGTATRLTTASVGTAYPILPYLNGSVRFGWNRAEYVNSIRVDDAWFAGATLTYTFWRDIGITLDYQYQRLDSNVPLTSYDNNIVLAGISYKY